MSQSREWTLVSEEQRTIIEKFHDNWPVPIGALANQLGLQIKVANLGPGISGQISKRENCYQIKVNRFEARERQRFTIAHEIAHFLLHRDAIDASPTGITDSVLYRSSVPDKLEYQANRLAADILMPIKSVEQKLSELGGRVTEIVIELLAQEFKVSNGAMEIRLQNFAD